MFDYEEFIGKILHPNDPAWSCNYYLEHGCELIDGLECRMKSCTILDNHKKGIPQNVDV
jgi:hypothetical protein